MATSRIRIRSSARRRPSAAYIPARYPRTTSSTYEHSRRSPAPLACAFAFAWWCSCGAALYAAVQLGWIPTWARPKSGVQSLLITASIESVSEAQPVSVIATRPSETADSHLPDPQRTILGLTDVSRKPHSLSGTLSPHGAADGEQWLEARERPTWNWNVTRRSSRDVPQMEVLPDARATPRPRLPVSMAVASSNAALSATAGGARAHAPELLDNPPPRFPPELLAAGIEGRVVVRATLRGDGRIERVRIHNSSGRDAFDRAALEAVAHWRFEADSDVPPDATVEINIPLRFRIERP